MPFSVKFFLSESKPSRDFEISCLLTGTYEDREKAQNIFDSLIYHYFNLGFSKEGAAYEMSYYQAICNEYNCREFSNKIDRKINRLWAEKKLNPSI